MVNRMKPGVAASLATLAWGPAVAALWLGRVEPALVGLAVVGQLAASRAAGSAPGGASVSATAFALGTAPWIAGWAAVTGGTAAFGWALTPLLLSGLVSVVLGLVAGGWGRPDGAVLAGPAWWDGNVLWRLGEMAGGALLLRAVVRGELTVDGVWGPALSAVIAVPAVLASTDREGTLAGATRGGLVSGLLAGAMASVWFDGVTAAMLGVAFGCLMVAQLHGAVAARLIAVPGWTVLAAPLVLRLTLTGSESPPVGLVVVGMASVALWIRAMFVGSAALFRVTYVPAARWMADVLGKRS